MDIPALSDDHQTGGALVQAVHRVEDEVRSPAPGQGPRHGGGVRQKIGGVGRHSRGLVHDQQMRVLPYHRQRPVSRRDGGLGRAAVLCLHGQHVPGPKDMGHVNGLAVDQNARAAVGQPGDGVGGKMELGPKDVAHGGPVLLRRNDSSDNCHAVSPYAHTALPSLQLGKQPDNQSALKFFCSLFFQEK